jgi:hypothetical protein
MAVHCAAAVYNELEFAAARGGGFPIQESTQGAFGDLVERAVVFTVEGSEGFVVSAWRAA